MNENEATADADAKQTMPDDVTAETYKNEYMDAILREVVKWLQHLAPLGLFNNESKVRF